MKKILQICNYYYPHVGGIEQVARDISQVLREQNLEQKIICFNEDAAADGYACKRRETKEDMIDGVSVIRCGCITKLRSQSISLSFHGCLKKILREYQPELVIFHYPNPWQALFLLKELPTETKLILYWHLDIVKQKILGRLFQKQNLALIQRAEKVIATSPLYIEGSPWLQQAKEKCEVIPNCVNEERLKPTEASERRAMELEKEYQGKILCFAAGRHVPYKGMRYLVEASKYLDDRFSICIAGKGEETETLKKMAEGDEKVHFLGRVSDDELKAYMQAADIFCFPSITKNEAFGIALAEAMYYENPAVTFTIPGSGVNYVSLNGETGIEVCNGDSKAFAEAVKQLAEDPERRQRLGQHARE